MLPNTSERNKKQEYIILLVLGTMIALGPFSIDAYLPGFENIAKDFNTSISQIGITLTSYFIGISIGQLAYGPIMDKYGRKKPLLIGLLLYLLSALSCMYSPNLEWLIISRFFLAVGAAAGMVAAKAIVRDIFPVNEVAGAISVLMLIMGGAPIIAPTVGSFIIDSFGWKTIFLFLAVFSALMIISVSRFLPESIIPDRKVDLKPKQVAIKYFGILTHPKFMNFAFAGSFAIGAMFAYISDAPKLFMGNFGLTQKEFGILFGLNAAGLILGSQINRLFLRKYSTFQITLFNSVILVVLSLLFLVNSFFEFGFITTVVLLFLMLFLLGFQNPNTTALSLEPFEKKAGRASALIGSLKMILGALTSFIISLFHSSSAIPLAIILSTCLFISSLLLFSFARKEKQSLHLSEA
ncbi:multidrug effflux MFS transporter [Christiangramia forsetii]|uniref:Bcr/CflA family drug resistance transporter n=2 Tax=Christiangramia forsetii TaxID=411153 RepID=A0LYZ9_CHRFK|nr:multidrug effflux MFS transporter [Christiangramia forsetii]GGG37045.1 Bcr/CflA family drug resistance efflux transporter [Christiangramia forsetii]CAL65594.1 Bcr/CflA family drug resistance transporter [Christiangramia forsetii KT0803]